MVRPRPRRAMRPPLAVRSARIVVPAVVLTALGVGVASAVMPGDNPRVAYPAPASTGSVEATAGALGVRGRKSVAISRERRFGVSQHPSHSGRLRKRSPPYRGSR